MKKIQKYRKYQEIVNNQSPLLINRGCLLSVGWPSLLHATVLYCSKFLSCLPTVIYYPYNLVPHHRPCVLCRYYSVTNYIFTSDPCHVKFIECSLPNDLVETHKVSNFSTHLKQKKGQIFEKIQKFAVRKKSYLFY